MGGSWWAPTAPGVTPGVWVHMAVVVNGNDISLYVNGILKQTQTAPGTLNTGSAQLIIGRHPNGISYFNGVMDELRVWNVAKSQAQLQAAMYTELAGNEAGLIAYFNFNQGVGGGNNTLISSLINSKGINAT